MLFHASAIMKCLWCIYAWLISEAVSSTEFIMVTLWDQADHYNFILLFVILSIFLSFFPHLISAAADWMSAILPHMVWP